MNLPNNAPKKLSALEERLVDIKKYSRSWNDAMTALNKLKTLLVDPFRVTLEGDGDDQEFCIRIKPVDYYYVCSLLGMQVDEPPQDRLK